MANYLLAYTGGGMAQTDAEREAAMAAWGQWFGTLGSAIVDAGNPFGAVRIRGRKRRQTARRETGLTGYSVLAGRQPRRGGRASSKGCPISPRGGKVDVYETIEVM